MLNHSPPAPIFLALYKEKSMFRVSQIIMIVLAFCNSAYAGDTKVVTESYHLPVSQILKIDQCLSNQQQVNGKEPLSLCHLDVNTNRLVTPIVLWPAMNHDELSFTLNDKITSCTGGIHKDYYLQGKVEAFVTLSPWRDDYTQEQFTECYQLVFSQINNNPQREIFVKTVHTAKK